MAILAEPYEVFQHSFIKKRGFKALQSNRLFQHNLRSCFSNKKPILVINFPWKSTKDILLNYILLQEHFFKVSTLTKLRFFYFSIVCSHRIAAEQVMCSADHSCDLLYKPAFKHGIRKERKEYLKWNTDKLKLTTSIQSWGIHQLQYIHLAGKCFCLHVFCYLSEQSIVGCLPDKNLRTPNKTAFFFRASRAVWTKYSDSLSKDVLNRIWS